MQFRGMARFYCEDHTKRKHAMWKKIQFCDLNPAGKNVATSVFRMINNTIIMYLVLLENMFVLRD